MKTAAILLLVLCLAALGFVEYLYLNSTIQIVSTDCIATDAMNQTELFTLLQRKIQDESFTGTRFIRDVPDSPDHYVFYSYTVQMENRTMIPAEVIELQVTPMTGDVLQIGELNRYDLAPGRSASLSVTILAPREAHNVRELTVSYYIWGLPFTVRMTSGGDQ